MTKESRTATLLREVGAWLKPRLRDNRLKFPSEPPGGTPQRGR